MGGGGVGWGAGSSGNKPNLAQLGLSLAIRLAYDKLCSLAIVVQKDKQNFCLLSAPPLI